MNIVMTDRRSFLKYAGAGLLGLAIKPSVVLPRLGRKKLFFDISLAEWSLHRTIFGGKLDNLDFPETAAKKFGIHAVEYVNQFFKDKAKDNVYLRELLMRSKDNGVKNV